MKISKRTRAIIGIVAIVAVVALAIVWNSFLRQSLTSTQVVVLKNNVFAGDKIDASNLTYKSISRTDLIPGAIRNQADVKALLSYEARQFIPSGIQLVPEFFETPDLVLDKGQFIFSVPSEWIAAVPATIRRRDTAYFYALSGTDVERIAQFSNTATPAATSTGQPGSAIVLPTSDATTAQDAATATPTPTATPVSTMPATSTAPMATVNPEEALLLKSLADGRQYEISAVIAYVRDKSNKEVITSSKDVAGKLERLDGSSSIDHIEIIVTQEQIDKMQTAALKGYKFVVLYQ